MFRRPELPDQLQELLAQELLAGISGVDLKFIRDGVEQPQEKALKEIVLLEVLILGPVATGKEHFRHIHPHTQLPPCGLAADIRGMAVARMLVGIVQVRGVYREECLYEDLLREKQHPCPEIFSCTQPVKERPCKEYQLGLLHEPEGFRSRRHHALPRLAHYIYPAAEMVRVVRQESQVGLLISDTVGVGKDASRLHTQVLVSARQG